MNGSLWFIGRSRGIHWKWTTCQQEPRPYGGARMARRAHAHKRLLRAHFRLTDTCDHREYSAINVQTEGQMVNRTWSLHRTQIKLILL